MSRSKSDLDALSALEAFDDFCFSTLDVFLEKHSLPVLRDRLFISFIGELESIHVLREFWFEYLEGSPKKLIEIYEKANDRKRVERYENLIVLFLVSFFAELLAALIAVEYSKNRDLMVETIKKIYKKSRRKIWTAMQGISEKYERFLKYLFRVYVLKAYIEKQRAVRYTDFMLLRESIKNNTILCKTPKEKLPEDYSYFEESFLREHSLPSLEECYSEKLGDELLSLSVADRQKPLSRAKIKKMISSNKPTGVFSAETTDLKKVISGIVANSGYATGKVKVVLGEVDCDKVEKGDIVVLVGSRPDFVRALRALPGALVADVGGLTAHVAIMGRALGIPTIVGTEKGTKVLEDGMNVFVDAVQGIVYEITF